MPVSRTPELQGAEQGTEHTFLAYFGQSIQVGSTAAGHSGTAGASHCGSLFGFPSPALSSQLGSRLYLANDPTSFSCLALLLTNTIPANKTN